MSKSAPTDHAVHDLIAKRWRPYAFGDQSVPETDLRSLFEAARWAPSSYNEQPWAYVIARREQPEAFARLLSCLVPGNQEWARQAPVLALGLCHENFQRNGKPNRHAWHDLGQATANLSLEATARGLAVHQMAGIDPELARKVCKIPLDWSVATGIAIGYPGEAAAGDAPLKERDAQRRPRKSMHEFVFAGDFGNAAY